jgi:translation elongation factor EF-G
MALTSEEALEELLESGCVSRATMRGLVARRLVVPCVCGSALHDQGVDMLLDRLVELTSARAWPDDFGARVYQIRHTERGERQCWLKVTGGALRARATLQGVTHGRQWLDKVDQLRVCRGTKLEVAAEVRAGELCVATGLSQALPGSGLGFEQGERAPRLAPVLTYRVLPGASDIHTVLEALQVLGDEDPMLGVAWDEELQELRLQLMGEIQLEVVRTQLQTRFGLEVDFGPGSVSYRESIARPVRGAGHFEPLRHYAEVHVLLEPLPEGRGLEFGSTCSEDELDRNWQRLILTNAMERPHRGVLTGAPLADVRITLVAGRAHPKHTEGGDFRQATYRAIRQALMQARSQDACVLLEPWYRFALEVPVERVGRALADLQRMSARMEPPLMRGVMALLDGAVPVSEVRSYAIEVAAYTQGQGSLHLELLDYEPCHDAARIVSEAAYEPEADLPHTPDSVFCAHGAGYTVKWYDVPAAAHVHPDEVRQTPWRPADASFFART